MSLPGPQKNRKATKGTPCLCPPQTNQMGINEQEIAVKQLAIGAFFFVCRLFEYLLVPASQH